MSINPLDPLEIFGSEPDLPPAPDFEALAESTAESDLEAARAATTANRYDQYTPMGSLTWTNLGQEVFDEDAFNAAMDKYLADYAAYESYAGPEVSVFDDYREVPQSEIPVKPVMPDRADYTTFTDQDKWRSDVTLSPEMQALFDKGLMMRDISADIGLTAGEQIKDIFATPFELDDFEGYREDVYDAMMSRLEEDIDRDWESRNAQLYAAGIGRGTEAYSWEQAMRDRSLNDARLQAYTQATDQALRERGQDVKEALLVRNQPLNEYNAWRTGAQVDLPSFEAGGMQQTTPGADYLTAGTLKSQYDLAGYNADVMMYNQRQQALADLATSIMDMFSFGGVGA